MEVLRQADPRWSQNILGNGSMTLGRAGCMLTCLTMAANHLKNLKLTPDVSNEKCKAAGAFQGSLLAFEKAATVLGVKAPDAERVRAKVGDARLWPLLEKTLQAGGVALVHVDHDNLEGGDHFVLAYELVSEGVRCADSAPGKVITLSKALEGESPWGKTVKRYRAVGVVPVRG